MWWGYVFTGLTDRVWYSCISQGISYVQLKQSKMKKLAMYNSIMFFWGLQRFFEVFNNHIYLWYLLAFVFPEKKLFLWVMIPCHMLTRLRKKCQFSNFSIFTFWACVSNIYCCPREIVMLSYSLFLFYFLLYKSASSDRTTIFIAHRLSTVIDADLIYVLDKVFWYCMTILDFSNFFSIIFTVIYFEIPIHPHG